MAMVVRFHWAHVMLSMGDGSSAIKM